MTTTKPTVKLLGSDGNAFAVLGACISDARRAGWTQSQIDAFRKEATSGDYTQLMATVFKHFEVE